MNDIVTLGDRRFLHPGKLRWLRALGWMIGLGFIVIVAFGIFAAVGFVAGQVIEHIPVRLQPQHFGGSIALIGAITGALGAIATYVFAVRLAEDRWPDEMAARKAFPEILIGLAIGAAMMGVVVLLMWSGGWVTITHATANPVVDALDDTVQSGVLEEILFRLVILRLVWRAAGAWPALAVSALLFGLAHLSNPNSSWFAAICIAVEAGIMLASFYILTRRVWVSVGIHAGWNFTQGWIFGAAVSGTAGFGHGPLITKATPGVAEWLSGGGFGPEASFAGLLVGTVVGVVVLFLAYRARRLPPIGRRASLEPTV